MDFKISTNPTYTLLTPDSVPPDANMAAAICQEWPVITESGSKNLILDMQHCQNLNPEELSAQLWKLHEDFYEKGHSLVLMNIPPKLFSTLKLNDEERLLNMVPTLSEAIDIVQMEMLERELLAGEDHAP